MATAVGEGGAVDVCGLWVLELEVKAGARPPTARTLFMWVNASWALNWTSCKGAVRPPIRSEFPGSPPTKGHVRSPGAGRGMQCSDSKETLKVKKMTREKNKKKHTKCYLSWTKVSLTTGITTESPNSSAHHQGRSRKIRQQSPRGKKKTDTIHLFPKNSKQIHTRKKMKAWNAASN